LKRKNKNKKNQAALPDEPIKEIADVTAEDSTEAPASEPETPAEAPAPAEEPAAEQAESAEASVESAEAPAQDDPAEKPEETEKDAKEKKPPTPIGEIVRITLPLTIICIVVSLMLALVNMFTADTIAANAAKEKENAILAIFPDGKKTELLSWAEGNEVFLVMTDNELLGCCISLSENGFGGAISMMVGLDSTGAVHGVRILSLSETPGLGTRVKNDSFLSGFAGREPFVIGENFDAISGATVSSTAMVRGVNRALELMPDMAAAAQKRGLTVADAPAQEKPAEPAEEVLAAPAEEIAPAVPEPTPLIPEAAETETVRINLAAYMPTFSVTPGASVNPVRLSDLTKSAVTAAPETATEETTLPETTAPETATEETTLPETTAPETVSEETTLPETIAPESIPAEPEAAVTETAAAIQ